MDYKLENLFRNDLPGNFNEFDLVKNQWPRIQNVFNGNKLLPHEIIIHPTWTCNLRCKWCIGQNVETSNKEQVELQEKLNDPNNMLKMLQNICSSENEGVYFENGKQKKEIFKVNNISFSGLIGEPLIAKTAVLKGMEYLVNQNIRTGIFTNGLLMDSQAIDTMANINYVLISIDAANNETYNFMKCSGLSQTEKRVDLILKNIAQLNDEKLKIKSNLDINVGFVVNEYNYKEIYKLASLLRKIGVHYLRLKFDIAIKHKLNNQQLDEVRNQILSVHNNLDNNYFKLIEIHRMSELISSDQKRLFNTCFINKIYAAIGPDAHLYACNYHAKEGGVRYGDVLNENFIDVWRNFNHCDVNLCPNVCDPFKNRANNMLSELYNIYNLYGMDAIEEFRKKLKINQGELL